MRIVAVASTAARAMLLGAVLAVAGCASTPADTLTARLDDEARRLTMDCYWHHEGERMVMGGLHIYQACRQWAQDQVQVRPPPRAMARAD